MNKSHQTLNDLRKSIASELEKVGIHNAFDESKWLILAALDADPGLFILNQNDLLEDDLVRRVNEFAKRRIKREPLSRIQGVREFWSLPFRLNSSTLDPRADSEILVEAALKFIPQKESKVVLDLGTGSGCLLISILCERILSSGVGIDISPRAAFQASQNAILNGVDDRSLLVTSSWGGALKDKCFDVIVSNPPYIPEADKKRLSPEVEKYDPDLALYGGHDGLDCYRTVAPEMLRLLKPEGICLLEIGYTQGDDVQSIFEDVGFTSRARLKDLAGKERVMVFELR